jgi:hypothetical protein
MRQIFFDVVPESQRQISSEAWWQSRWFWWLLAFASVVPFLVSPLPPLGDLFSHMGRYHVMLHRDESPWLQRYYAFHWGILPNLGQDLLMLVFGRIFGVERGALILAALLAPAMVLGFRSLSKAAHGTVQPTALLALPFAYSFTYLFGFMNYHTGIVAMLWSLVLWFRTPDWPPARKTLVFTLLSLIVWICHIGAWVVLLLALGSLELARALRVHQGKIVPACRDVSLRVVPLLLPALLLLFGPTGQGGGQVPGNPGYYLKFYWLLYPLRDESRMLDVASLLLLAGVPLIALATGKAWMQAGLGLFAALLFVLFWALPLQFLSGSYGDLRLLPVLWIAALLAVQMRISPAWAQRIAIGALLLFGVRLVATSHGWMVRGAELKADLRALEHVPEGARIASFTPGRTCKRWWNDGLSHLPSLAIVRRNAFVNSEWDLPTQNLMQPKYLPGSLYNSATLIGIPGTCTGPSAESMVATLPRDRFDFVWVLRAELPEDKFKWLAPVYRGPNSTLYKINIPTHTGQERQ